MRRILAVLMSLTAMAACAGDDAQNAPPASPSSTMTFGGTDATLSVEVADETDEQERGLMGVEHLPADQIQLLARHDLHRFAQHGLGVLVTPLRGADDPERHARG